VDQPYRALQILPVGFEKISLIFLKINSSIFANICLYKACGNVYATNNVRIVGGIVANQGSWPSIAYIRWNYRGDYTLPTGVTVTASAGFACDGTLISTRKILTAGKIQIKSLFFYY